MTDTTTTELKFISLRPKTPIKVDWENRDQAAKHHLRTAIQLAALVREVDPVEIQDYLKRRLPTDKPGMERELRSLVVIMAMLVDDTRTPRELLAWHTEFGCEDFEWWHRKFVRYQDMNTPIEEIPYGVVKGEQAYQEALRKRAKAWGARRRTKRVKT